MEKSKGKVTMNVQEIKEKYQIDKRQTGQLGVQYAANGKAFGTSVKNYGKGTSAENTPEISKKVMLRMQTKNGSMAYEKLKQDSEGFVSEVNGVLAKYMTKFSGDKPAMQAFKNIRNSVKTFMDFMQKRKNMMYKTNINIF